MTIPTKQFLTDDIVRALPLPAKGAPIFRDDDAPGLPGTSVTGFGARVTPKGSKTLVIQYRDRESGDQKTYKIGRWPAVKVERGREIARKLRAKIEEGFDPQDDRAAKRAEATVNDLADRFERDHLPRKRPSTAENYARLLRLYIRPHLGRMRLSAVERADVERMLRDVTEFAGPYQSNRVHGVGSKLFSTAVRWSLLSPAQGNPFHGIERHKEHHRRRYASANEVRRLVVALAQHPDRQSADAIKLLLLTGARRGEVLSMRWADVDLDAATWSRKAADLKQGRDHALPLSAPAIAILSAIRAEQSVKDKRQLGEWVFPSAASKSKHLVAIRRLWRNVVKSAELGDLRLHDIRHTVASQLVSSGASLALVGSLLGHSSPQITARYAHLIDTVEREAVGKIGAWVEAAGGAPMSPESPSGDVITFPRP